MADSNLQTVAYDKLREDIVFCRLTPGQKLSAKRLEETLGVGRTPIRESLVRLAQQRLVYTVPQSGTYVSLINMREAENARFVREQLEQRIVIECSARITEQGCAQLADIIVQQERSLADRDSRSFFVLDNRFHEELFRIAGRHDIWRWLEATNTNLQRYRWLRMQVQDLDWDTLMQQHYQLYEAIRTHNPEEAGYLSTAHLHLMASEQAAVTGAFPAYFEQ